MIISRSIQEFIFKGLDLMHRVPEELGREILDIVHGERTWDCSPGHAGKDGPHLAMTEGSCGLSRAAAPVWGFTRGTTGSSGSLSRIMDGI